MPATPWFDREDLLNALTKRLDGFVAGYRQNLALLGPEAIGKTTLLKRFLHQKFPSHPPMVILHLLTREEESFAEWAIRFIETLLCGIVKTRRSGEVPMKLSQLMEVASADAPQTTVVVGNLLALIEEGRNEKVYDQIWDLPYLTTQETGLPSLVILDEFQRLKQLPVKEPFRQLGRKIMVQSKTLYIVAASQVNEARSILKEGLSLLFGQFEILEMGPLHAGACLKAIRAVWPEGRIDPFCEHLLLELAQGYPGCLDLLLQGFMDREYVEDSTQQERLLLDILESLLLEPSSSLRHQCEARMYSLPTHQNRRMWIQVLCTIAQGVHRIPHITEFLHRNRSQVSQALRTLEQLGFVSKDGVFYKIPDRLFQLWLLTAYPILSGVTLTDAAQTRAGFRDAAWSWMAQIRETIRRPMAEQCLALVRRWGGELVEIEGWRHLLPSFQRVESVSIPGDIPALIAHRAGSGGKGWLIIPWDGSLQEGDAQTIAQKIRKSSWKGHRAVLLGADPVEINARLILQEARIRLWDRDVLNRLLDLYGLPRVPVSEEAHPRQVRPISFIPDQALPPIQNQVQKIS